jgi:hypothetical protein
MCTIESIRTLRINRKLNKITHMLVSEGTLYFRCVRNDETCTRISTSLGLVNVCRCFARPVVPRKVRRNLRRRETRSGTEKLGGRGCIAVVLHRAIYRSLGFIGFVKFGWLRSVWDIAASRTVEIVGVLITRTSQERFEMSSTHLPHN